MEQLTPWAKAPETASKKTLIAYSLAFAPSAVLCYNAFYLYYMYFMTDVAHINPITAGYVSLIAISWDAISDPTIAVMSDRCRWKAGRRTPFMIIGLLVMTVALTLVFNVIDASERTRTFYFVCMTILFWTGATMWDIPHNALGAELVSKQSEREKLRIGTTIVDGCGLMLVSYVIPNLSDYFIRTMPSEAMAWRMTIICICALALVIGLFTWNYLRKKEPKVNWEAYDELHKNDEKKESLLVVIKELFLLKPYKFLCGVVVFGQIGNVCFQSSIVYFMTYISGFTAFQQSIVLLVHYLTQLVIGLVLAAGLQKVVSSRKMFIGGLALGTFASVVFPNFMDCSQMPILLIYSILLACSVRAIWLYCYIFAYQCAMLDDIKNEKHREGNIVGFMSLGLKLGAALASWIIGFVLNHTGYDGTAAVQTAEALNGLKSLLGIYGAIFLAIALLLAILWPMREKQADAIEKAIEARDAGEEYSTEEFKNLL